MSRVDGTVPRFRLNRRYLALDGKGRTWLLFQRHWERYSEETSLLMMQMKTHACIIVALKITLQQLYRCLIKGAVCDINS